MYASFLNAVNLQSEDHRKGMLRWCAFVFVCQGVLRKGLECALDFLPTFLAGTSTTRLAG